MIENFETENAVWSGQSTQLALRPWAHLHVDMGRFGQYLTERGIDPRHVAPNIAADLYLAFACVCRLPGAHEAFGVAYGPVVAQACSSFNPSAAFADDIMQNVMETLLVASPENQPRIAQYSGKGSLAGWVKIAARRMALRASKNGEILSRDDSFVADMVEEPEFEAMLTKHLHRDELARIVGAAVRASPERRLIQLVFGLGFSMARAGQTMQLSQPAVSRRLKKALDGILETVKEDVRRRFQLDEESVDSFLALFESQIHLQSVLAFEED